MDNSRSQPSLKLPTIPKDAEKKAGATKTEFLTFLFALLKGATVEGIISTEPTPFDLAKITAQIDDLIAANEVAHGKVRHQVLDAVSNGPIVVTFPDIGTTLYSVDVAFVTPNEDYTKIQWAIVAESKKTNQVTLRIDGQAGPFQLEVTIRELKEIT